MRPLLDLLDEAQWQDRTVLVTGAQAAALAPAVLSRGAATVHVVAAEEILTASAPPAASDTDIAVYTNSLSALRAGDARSVLQALHSRLRGGGRLLLQTETFFAPGPGAPPRPTTPFAQLAFARRDIDAVVRERTGEAAGALNPMGSAAYLMLFHRLGFGIERVEPEIGEPPAALTGNLAYYDPRELTVHALSVMLQRLSLEPAMSQLRSLRRSA